MENNTKNREAFFEDITPCGDGYSIIDGRKVHIDTLTEIEAVGTTDGGDWFAAKKDFGILKFGLTTALADDEIAKEELTIPEERRVSKFLESHSKDELYTVEHFSSWYRRLTGACLTGRNEFIAKNNVEADDLCSARFFLDTVCEQNVANKSIEYLREQYLDSEKICVRKGSAKNEDSNISTTV